MEKQKWSKDMELGISVLDFQHKKIVNLINDLIDEMEVENVVDISSEIGLDLAEAVQEHMKYEENLLKELNYIDTDEHKNSHKKYIKAVEEYSQNIKNGDSESIYKLINYVKSWWIEHITTEDVKYKSFLLNNNFN